MNNLFTAIVFLVFLFQSCKKDEIKIDTNNQLLGTWNLSEYVDNASVYAKSTEFVENYGYQFKDDGTLIERKNSGWCGTPPIVFGDYSGSWTILNDTLVQIETGYWGGTTTYQLDIEFVDGENLKVILVSPKK